MAIDDNTTYGLTGAQVKDLASKVNNLKTNAGAPTTATVGTVGQLLADTTNGKLYICTAIIPGTDPDPDTYTWTEVGTGGGGGITTLASTDYDWPENNPDGVALWKLDNGLYNLPHGVKAYTSNSTPVVDNHDTSGTALVLIAKRNQCNITIFADSQYGLYIKNYTTMPSNGQNTSSQSKNPDGNTVLIGRMIQDNLTSTSTTAPLSANQGKVLSDKIEGRIITNAGAPTTSTVGTKGQILEDTTNGKLYICTDATNPYVWEEVSTGSVPVITMTSTDPGEGQPLAANNFIAVY